MSENNQVENTTLKENSISRSGMIIMSISAAAPGLCLGGTTGAIMQGTGSALALAFCLATLVIVMVGISYGQLSVRYNSAGGTYSYIRSVLGAKTGFVSGWVHNGIGICSGSIGAVFAIYLHELVPAIPMWACVLMLLIPIFFILWNGVEMTTKVLIAVWVVQMLLLVYPAVKIILLRSGVIENVWANSMQAAFVPNFGITGLMLGTLVCVYSFVGFECPAYMGEELKGGSKSVRFTIIAGVIAIGLIYVILYWLWTAVMQRADVAEIMNSPTSLADYAVLVGYYEGGILISIGTIVSTIGSFFGFAATTIRILYDMGRTGYLPPLFSKLNKHQIPHVSLVFYSISWVIIAIFGAYVSADALFTMVAMCASVCYVLICLSHIKDRWKERGVGSTILNKIVPAIACLILTYMIFSSGWLYIAITAGWALAFWIISLIWDKKRKEKLA